MLTDTRCRTAKTKSKEKPYKLVDGKGLCLEVKPNGIKAIIDWLFSRVATAERCSNSPR